MNLLKHIDNYFEGAKPTESKQVLEAAKRLNASIEKALISVTKTQTEYKSVVNKCENKEDT